MKRITLIGAYGYWNYGDDLLAWIFAKEIKKKWPGSELFVSSPPDGKEYITQILNADYTGPITSVKYWIKRDSKEYFKKSDLLIFGGGGILYDYPISSRLKNLDPRRASSLFYLTSLLTNRRSGTTIAHGIGIGPLDSTYAKFMTRIFLKRINHLTVRDEESKDLARKFGKNSNTIPDPSFILAEYYPREEKQNLKKKIGVVIRKWEHHPIFNTTEKMSILFDQIEKATNIEVIPISLRTGEFNSIGNRKVLEWNPLIEGPIEFAHQLADFTLLITMRLHAMNVAACYGTPSIAIGIDPKIVHAANSLGLEDYLCNPDFTSEEIVKKVTEMLQDESLKEDLIKRTKEMGKSSCEYLEKIIVN